jgi:hypothetical protein
MIKLNSKKSRFFFTLLVSAIMLLQLTLFVPVVHGWDTPAQLDVEVDVGSVYFRGETAEFYVLVSSAGNRESASLCASLYFNGTLYASLTGSVKPVATGLYRIPYAIPLNASAGEYALIVDASVCGVDGTGMKVFLLSQTLTG